MCQWENTLLRENRWWDGFNRPCRALFPTVDVVAKQRYVKQTKICVQRGSSPKAFDISAGKPNLPITSWSVDNIHNRVLYCTSIGINYACMADFCADNTQQADFDELVVCGLWRRASQKWLRMGSASCRVWTKLLSNNARADDTHTCWHLACKGLHGLKSPMFPGFITNKLPRVLLFIRSLVRRLGFFFFLYIFRLHY